VIWSLDCDRSCVKKKNRSKVSPPRLSLRIEMSSTRMRHGPIGSLNMTVRGSSRTNAVPRPAWMPVIVPKPVSPSRGSVKMTCGESRSACGRSARGQGATPFSIPSSMKNRGSVFRLGSAVMSAGDGRIVWLIVVKKSTKRTTFGSPSTVRTGEMTSGAAGTWIV
jgi:hypothetical protein